MTVPDPTAPTAGPCTCWIEVALHEGHCCLRDLPDDATELECGHDEQARAILDRLASEAS